MNMFSVAEEIEKADAESTRHDYLRALETLYRAKDTATAEEKIRIADKENQIRRAQKQAAEPIVRHLRDEDRKESPHLTNAERLINELTQILGENDSTIRYWQDRFLVWQRNADALAVCRRGIAKQVISSQTG